MSGLSQDMLRLDCHAPLADSLIPVQESCSLEALPLFPRLDDKSGTSRGNIWPNPVATHFAQSVEDVRGPVRDQQPACLGLLSPQFQVDPAMTSVDEGRGCETAKLLQPIGPARLRKRALEQIDAPGVQRPQALTLSPSHLLRVDPFQTALETMQAEIGTLNFSAAQFCGTHARIGALLDDKLYKEAPRLSQVIVDLIRSLRPAEQLPSTTTITVMWLHWCLWRWVLWPTPEHYDSLPRIIQPTATQATHPHSLATKFVIVPEWRDWLCRSSSAFAPDQLNLYRFASFRGPQTTLHALCKHSTTRHIDLTRECRSQALVRQRWSLKGHQLDWAVAAAAELTNK